MSCNIRVAILVLGYFKLVLLDLPPVGPSVYFLYDIISQLMTHGKPLLTPLVMFFYVLVEITFCILLLVGSHKKNRSLLRVYFWYAIAGVILKILLSGSVVASNVTTFINYHQSRHIILRNPDTYITILWFGLVYIAIQISLLVLVNKEIRILKNNTNSPKTSDANAEEMQLQNIS